LERRNGFTLVEMLLVIVFLGILAAIVVPRHGRPEAARRTAAQTAITIFKTALDSFKDDNGIYPKGTNGLLDLIQAPANAPRWRGPYLQADRIPLDPWDNPYIYVGPGRHNPSGYDLSSPGQDGRPGTDDDIVNWLFTMPRN
jgi:general secretion pathway protein G